MGKMYGSGSKGKGMVSSKGKISVKTPSSGSMVKK